MIKKLTILIFFFSGLYSSEITSYNKIVEESINYNFALKILEIEKKIAQASIDEIDSLYLPQVDLELLSQYTRDIETSDGRVHKLTSSLLQDDTMFTSFVTLNLSWDIVDFGVRDDQKRIAQIDQKLIDYVKEEKIEELKLKLLEHYTKILDSKKQLASQREIQLLNSEVYEKKRRLYKADQIDKISLANEAIKIVEQDRKILDLKLEVDKSLKEINHLTNKKYTMKDTFLPLVSNLSKIKTYKDSFIYKSFKEKIKQKKYEISKLKKEQYPKINFFYNYNYYDEGISWKRSLYPREKDYQLGLKLRFNLFDGFLS